MSDKGSSMSEGGKTFAIGVGGVIAVGIGIASLVKMGYEFGINQSRKVLKRHDKDMRRADKRERMIYREQKKKERKQEKEQRRQEKRQRLQKFVDEYLN